MRVPEVADRLRELATEHSLAELDMLASELQRRRPVSRAKPHSRKMTFSLRADILHHAHTHPGLSQLQIANHFGVNPGRVSETLRGFRQ